MKTTILLFVLLVSLISFGQNHNNLKEYGYRGSVKQIITLNYDTLTIDQKNKAILDTAQWRNKIIYKFNTDGNFDTIKYYTKLPSYPGVIFYSGTVYKYENNSRIAFIINDNNEITDTLKFEWMTPASYKTYEINKAGQTHMISESYLNSNYRDLSGKYSGYTSDNKISYDEFYTNTIGKNNLLTKSVKTDLVNNKAAITLYKYFNFDKMKNPEKIFLINSKDEQVYKIAIRKFEYY